MAGFSVSLGSLRTLYLKGVATEMLKFVDYSDFFVGRAADINGGDGAAFVAGGDEGSAVGTDDWFSAAGSDLGSGWAGF